MFTDEHIQMIRDEREGFEKTKKVSKRILEFMYDQQLFKLFIPESLGGQMLEFPKAVDLFQEASRIDGSFGWLVTIGAGGGMFVPNMKEKTAKAVYSPGNAGIAGSGFPAGTAKPTEHGYILNGQWFYCSGSQYASTFTATCVVNHEDESKHEIIAAALEPEQVQVIKDWDAFGLKGTSSHTITVKDQFVPYERIFSVVETENNYGGFVHTLPFMFFSEASFAAISLGIGQHFLEEVAALLEENKDNWQQGANNRYDFLMNKLQEVEKRWNKANDYFHEYIKTSWEQHLQGKELSEETLQEFPTIAKRSVTTALHCANKLFRYIGMSMVMESNLLNQIWRDLHTAAQHTFLTPYEEIEMKPY